MTIQRKGTICDLGWLPQREAFAFIKSNHRHHPPPRGDIFRIGAFEDGVLIGVILIGRPTARKLQQQGRHIMEVTRCCVLPGKLFVASKLYGAAWRAAKAMGCTWLLTYTLPTESGASLRAVGWSQDIRTPGKGWSQPSRSRQIALYPLGEKLRWSVRKK